MLISTGLVLALLASLSVAPAGAAPGEPTPPGRALSTPELLERAVERGRLNRATADVYLARALGAHRKLPDRFVSDVPWDGTLPLLRLQERLQRMAPGPERRAIRSVIDSGTCDTRVAPLPVTDPSTFFHIEYDGTIGGGITIDDYKGSLDDAWTKEVATFGWAAPPVAPVPAPGNKYHVRIEDLGPSLYGFVSSLGTHAGFVGDNPNTPAWNEGDSIASCMVLNEDYSGFPSPPQASLDATTAHEFNHSIQFGYGVLTGPNAADDAFVEGGATWMEDEVFDDANDNYFYLWPDFAQSMGEYADSPYPYWVIFRALTERYGTGTAGAGEQVMQDFWEAVSQSPTAVDLAALELGLGNKGTNLAEAYHAAAVALRFNQPCAGGWTYPYCLEEGPMYVGAAAAPPSHGAIATPGSSFPGVLEDNYALNWITLPGTGPYPVALRNGSEGGLLRASVACATSSGPRLVPLPAPAGPGEDRVLLAFDPSGCLGAPVAVITNHSRTAPNPVVSDSRDYVLFASLAPKAVKLTAKPRKVDPGERSRLKATVTPCAGHEGDAILIFRGKKKVATKQTNGACAAKVKVKVSRTSVFRAVSPPQDDDHLKGTSKKVKVRVRQA